MKVIDAKTETKTHLVLDIELDDVDLGDLIIAIGDGAESLEPLYDKLRYL